ncbi:hypothetical protein AQUCO_01500295v1 [Aquilegia coerulea]|uniref:Peptide deformylase n=1 Tax=Aquilegia coerulea TaxID=218851 RepID=A0A2G5DT16_AQUCA|nr:hypothetical protein AQUCO_01500295v1 [Aquilegia coerulea]
MESVHRIIISHSHRLLVIFPKITTPHQYQCHNHKCFKTKNPIFTFHGNHLLQQQQAAYFISKRTSHSTCRAAGGWFLGIGGGGRGRGDNKSKLPDIVKAGDPVLHEPAQDVPINEIASQNIQNIIDNMINVMRMAPGVGLAAPQIGIPFKIIVLEDTKEYINYASKEEIEAQDRRPFELLVILNPRLKKKDGKTALFFEGCLRHLSELRDCFKNSMTDILRGSMIELNMRPTTCQIKKDKTRLTTKLGKRDKPIRQPQFQPVQGYI